mmetsp:Transcript_1012/g.2362  ORF Transcript_1012/g.2362 Transcript_1012/m.2362 type:complete len:293 (+) Transcript_1012:823-1701(+)
MIAAQRALEHERSDRLFSDPLAAVLAGEQAMQRARERLRLRTQEGEKTGSERAGSKAMEGRIAVRTRYFDDAIVAALEGGAVQVVMLGAGMDTRPWRLRLPPGVAWFELDQADVMAAKLATMTAAGAQLRGGTSQGSGAKHPLMVATWSSVAADLCQPGWVEALVAAGFDAARPTVWAAEGLLMYLPEDAVRQLLTTARAISAPGSRATFSMVNDAATAYAQQSGSELTSTWKWGLPEGDAGLQFFRECGWATEHLDQLGDARASYGRYAVAPQPADTPGARRTLYWQGHPA